MIDRALLCDHSQVIHASLAAQNLLRFVDQRGGGEAVLAGDFNFQPGSAPYKLVTGGNLAGLAETDIPPKRDWDPW